MEGKRVLKKKKSLSDILLNVIIVAVIVAGVGLLSYPTVANWWNGRHNSHAVAAYEDAVSHMDMELYQTMWGNAEAYNKDLLTRIDRWKPSDGQHEEYNSLLNLDNIGILTYVEIPRISVKLPVYHGTDETTLAVAVGHLEGSSLPVGGTASHVILSGHSALPSARLFTDLAKVEVGDKFYLHTLGTILAYEVKEINVVLPHEFEYFDIDMERDLCTLVTCTPYGVNSHRLLVTGERIEYTPEKNSNGEVITPDIQEEKPVGMSNEQKFGFVAIGVSVACLGLFSVVVNHGSKKKKGGHSE